MTRMKDREWPQPTHNVISEGSPKGHTVVHTGRIDLAGKPIFETVTLNRHTRRVIAATTSTRLERLADQDERKTSLRQRVKKTTKGRRR